MRFAELVPGAVIESEPRRVEEEEILAFARRYDAQWFHTDPERARAGRWQGLIASGWHTCAIAMELAVARILTGSESYGSPGLDHIRWLAPVRPGDALRLRVEVLERSVSASGGTGIVRWQWQLHNDAGRAVLDLHATSLFDLSGPTSAKP